MTAVYVRLQTLDFTKAVSVFQLDFRIIIRVTCFRFCVVRYLGEELAVSGRKLKHIPLKVHPTRTNPEKKSVILIFSQRQSKLVSVHTELTKNYRRAKVRTSASTRIREATGGGLGSCNPWPLCRKFYVSL